MKTTTKKVRLGAKCGDCLHFRQMGKFEDVCKKLGVSRKAPAPDCFSPDFYQLSSVNSPEKMAEIARAVKGLRPAQKRILAFTLTRAANHLSKLGFYFGQRVYFSLGGNYLAHYFKGYVTGYNDGMITIVARLKKAKKNTTIQLLPESVLNRKEFKRRRSILVKQEKVVMKAEDIRFYSKLPIGQVLKDDGTVPWREKEELLDYEPPTLDTAPDEWFDRHEAKQKKKKSKRYIPITNIEDIPTRKKKKKSRINFTADVANM